MIFPALWFSSFPFPFTKFPSTSSLPLEISFPLFSLPELFIISVDKLGEPGIRKKKSFKRWSNSIIQI